MPNSRFASGDAIASRGVRNSALPFCNPRRQRVSYNTGFTAEAGGWKTKHRGERLLATPRVCKAPCPYCYNTMPDGRPFGCVAHLHDRGTRHEHKAAGVGRLLRLNEHASPLLAEPEPCCMQHKRR